jgi:hypothetical protein
MKITTALCDLCALEVVVRIAVAGYRTDVGRFHVCAKHEEQVQRAGLIPVRFDMPGDVPPDRFRE